jgi:non-specific serine/threonine protein kinase
MLLVLDTLEHLLPAAPLLASLLVACPRLAILATSRTLLQVRGEQALPVPPLPLPPAPHPSARAVLPSPEELDASPAVALFVERAQAVRPNFALTPANTDEVVTICRRLDGLPLALELAAARIRLLPPGALLARLEQRLPSLVGGPRDLPERHQTLRAALAWSYDLLPVADQALFRRLSVFAGGATLEAIETVCRDDAASEVDVLEGLAALVDHSLLHSQGEIAGEPRFSMLDTVREYGSDLLTARGEWEAVERAHAGYYLALVEAAEPALRGPEHVSWMERLETEIDNLRAALRWAQAHDQRETGLRLGGGLWRFWWGHGHLSEGRAWLEGFLADKDDHVSEGADPARQTEALSDLRAKALAGAGILAAEQADYPRATARLEESLALRRALGDTRGGAEVLNILGTIARDQDQYERATTLFGECLEILRALGDIPGVATSLSNLGEVARYRGDLDRARALHDESLTMFRALGDKQSVATSLYNHGLVAHDRGDHERALALHQESLALFHAMGDTVGVAWSLEGLAGVNLALGAPERAARLLGTAAALRDALGAPLPPAARAAHGRVVAAVRTALGAEACDAAWAQGRSLSPEQAIDLALSPTSL